MPGVSAPVPHHGTRRAAARGPVLQSNCVTGVKGGRGGGRLGSAAGAKKGINMAQDALRVGIVGANPARGWAQAAHIPALRALPQFRIAAVATTRQDSALATADRHGVPLAYDDWRRMIAEAPLDAVLVAVKVPAHLDIVLAAADAGLHVFCEWPLGLNAAEAAEMLRAVERRGVRHMVGLQSHVHPVLAAARDLVRQGAIGRVISTTLVASLGNWGPVLPAGEAYRMDARFGATGLTVPGGHTLDALVTCLGDFTDLSAVVATPQPVAVIAGTGEAVAVTAPTQLLVSGRLQGGALASVHVKADIHAPAGLRFDINGTEGDLLITSTPPIGASPVGIQRAELTLHGALRGSRHLVPLPITPAELPAELSEGPPRYAALMLARFAHSIRTGEAMAPDFGTALARHRLLEAVADASTTGARVVMRS
jgi:predicted dehydrogenase